MLWRVETWLRLQSLFEFEGDPERVTTGGEQVRS
jgi:hypothetical protein